MEEGRVTDPRVEEEKLEKVPEVNGLIIIARAVIMWVTIASVVGLTLVLVIAPPLLFIGWFFRWLTG